MTKKLLTLCIVHQNDRVLLGMKKRGIGAEKWNGFGGKVEIGETIEEAAMREVSEEVGIIVSSIEKIGVLDFTLPNEPLVWQTHIFRAKEFFGNPIETDEMRPQWFSIQDIPYDTMWADDRYWMPIFLKGKNFRGRFLFGENDILLEQKLEELA